MYPKCILPGFADQIHNVSLMRPIGRIHAGYILNVPHLSNVIGLGSKCVRSMKLDTLRSHDWVHSKSNQHVSQEQIKITFMGTFPMYPLFARWAHWDCSLSAPAMCSACTQQVNNPLSPVSAEASWAWWHPTLRPSGGASDHRPPCPTWSHR